MKAISTKYLGPTNTRGSRIKAYDCDNNQVSIPYPHEYDTEEAHRRAAIALCNKMGWTTDIIGGGTKEGYAWVFVGQYWKNIPVGLENMTAAQGRAIANGIAAEAKTLKE